MQYNHQTGGYDGRKLKSSDLKENAAIKLPGPASAQYEAELALRSELYRQTVGEYKDMNNIKKKQKSNLSIEQ